MNRADDSGGVDKGEGMSLCIICHTRDATIPDRNTGSSKKRLCSKCHAERLKDDLRHIIKLNERDRQGKDRP